MVAVSLKKKRNRLLLARLFAQPSNVLVLDEPTNDLDLDTLDLLEQRVAGYGGTVLVVSHDRDFLNAVADRTLVFEKYDADETDGPWLGPDEGWFVNEYAGGYDDWAARQRPPPVAVPPPQAAAPRGAAARKRRLGFAERRELEELPRRIEALDAEQAALHAQLADPAFYRAGDPEAIARARGRTRELDDDLAAAYARWEELEKVERSVAEESKGSGESEP